MKSLSSVFNRQLLPAAVLTLTALGFAANSQAGGPHHHRDLARVTSVQPVYRTVTHKIPEQHCRVEMVAYQRDAGRSHKGTVVGGIIGAAVGHRVGHRIDHRHNTASTLAGAVVGAAIGHEIDRSRRQVTEYREVERCTTGYRYENRRELVGYDVGYRYQGRLYRTHTKQHPGKHIRVDVNVRPSY